MPSWCMFPSTGSLGGEGGKVLWVVGGVLKSHLTRRTMKKKKGKREKDKGSNRSMLNFCTMGPDIFPVCVLLLPC